MPTLRLLVERVLADHDERSRTGAVRPVADPDAAIEALVSSASGQSTPVLWRVSR